MKPVPLRGERWQRCKRGQCTAHWISQHKIACPSARLGPRDIARGASTDLYTTLRCSCARRGLRSRGQELLSKASSSRSDLPTSLLACSWCVRVVGECHQTLTPHSTFAPASTLAPGSARCVCVPFALCSQPPALITPTCSVQTHHIRSTPEGTYMQKYMHIRTHGRTSHTRSVHNLAALAHMLHTHKHRSISKQERLRHRRFVLCSAGCFYGTMLHSRPTHYPSSA